MTEGNQAERASKGKVGSTEMAPPRPLRQRPVPLPTVRELADAMGVHPSTCYRGVADGSIAAVKLRGVIRIPWREYRRLTGEA